MLFLKKSYEPILFYSRKQVFQAFKKFAPYDLAKTAHILKKNETLDSSMPKIKNFHRRNP